MAGLLNVLDQFQKSGSSVSPVLSSATKHMDSIYMSRYYNWRSGSAKDAYTHVAYYRLKADAPVDALDTLSKNLFVPLFEKLLADARSWNTKSIPKQFTTKHPVRFGSSTFRKQLKDWIKLQRPGWRLSEQLR